MSAKDEEVSFVDGVLEGALGALGDEFGSLGDGVFVSSWVKSTNNCFGGDEVMFVSWRPWWNIEALSGSHECCMVVNDDGGRRW
ncbi:hypothetical protein Tco_0098739 [Tanacetum coccineum]